jgi:hypothetical protein
MHLASKCSLDGGTSAGVSNLGDSINLLLRLSMSGHTVRAALQRTLGDHG